MDDYPISQKVIDIEQAASGFYSIILPNVLKDFSPGQFVMLWIPRLDEKPFGVSMITKDTIEVTFEAKGKFTQALSKLKKGDLVGVRGPYGNGFPAVDKGTVIVAGGCGIAPLAPLCPKARHCVIGARTESLLLFRDRFPDAHFCTDDGSYGEKGYVTDELERLIAVDKAITKVFVCGPEIMMKKTMELCAANAKGCFLSIERYMKCGFGVCGQCLCGDIVTCKDGPVVEASRLSGNEDFGSFARLKSGKRVSAKEYYSYRST
jgi:dihydroorotate dehydrogenase electron transfer subunit